MPSGLLNLCEGAGAQGWALLSSVELGGLLPMCAHACVLLNYFVRIMEVGNERGR